jgi:hypothetical protein
VSCVKIWKNGKFFKSTEIVVNRKKSSNEMAEDIKDLGVVFYEFIFT